MSPDQIAWLVGLGGPWALVLARVVGFCWTAPVLATPGLGGRGRMVLAACLTGLIAPMVALEVGSPPGWAALLGSAAVEVAIGAGLGWAGSLVISGARQAGEVVGAQAGLSPASLFDPTAGDGMTPLGHLYGLVAIGVFLTLDGPTQLVLALAESFRVIPPRVGVVSISPEVANRAFAAVGRSLALALRASAPAALALTAASLALGLLGRAAPSLQLVSLSWPVRVVLGLALAMLGLVTLTATLGDAWRGAIAGW